MDAESIHILVIELLSSKKFLLELGISIVLVICAYCFMKRHFVERATPPAMQSPEVEQRKSVDTESKRRRLQKIYESIEARRRMYQEQSDNESCESNKETDGDDPAMDDVHHENEGLLPSEQVQDLGRCVFNSNDTSVNSKDVIHSCFSEARSRSDYGRQLAALSPSEKAEEMLCQKEQMREIFNFMKEKGSDLAVADADFYDQMRLYA